MTPERRDEIAVRVVSTVVVGSVALALAGLTWRLTGWDDGRSEVAVAETLPPPGGAAGGPAGGAEVARIVSLAPFGGGAATAVGGLPASSLGLILKGILMAFPASASTVLISVGEAPAMIYGLGQSPGGGGVIEAIEIDHVILKVGDTRERLDFPLPVAGTAPVAPTTTPGAGITVTPVTPRPPVPVPAPPAATPPPAAAAGGGSAPATGAAAAGPVPSAGALGVTATASGYRVGDNPSAELRRFGLQSGDVIETLNGQAVGNSATDQQLFERARSSGQARVVVVRDGRRLTLNFPLR